MYFQFLKEQTIKFKNHIKFKKQDFDHIEFNKELDRVLEKSLSLSHEEIRNQIKELSERLPEVSEYLLNIWFTRFQTVVVGGLQPPITFQELGKPFEVIDNYLIDFMFISKSEIGKLNNQ